MKKITSKKLQKKIILEELIFLAKKGEIKTTCSSCALPLTVLEFENLNCDRCGKISDKDIKVMAIDNIIYS